jgi:hypothetical protein
LINSSASWYLGLIKHLNGLGYLGVNIISNLLLVKVLKVYSVKPLLYSPLGMSTSPVFGSTQFKISIVARIEETVSHTDEKARYLPGQILKQNMRLCLSLKDRICHTPSSVSEDTVCWISHRRIKFTILHKSIRIEAIGIGIYILAMPNLKT